MKETVSMRNESDNQLITIERAVPADAEAIMTLKRATWLATYVNTEHGITADDIMKKFPDSSMPTAIENWRSGIERDAGSTQRAVFVARVGGKVVGFTAPRIEEDGQRRVGAMYVSPDEQGGGVGGKLLRKAIEWHGRDEDIYLHVVSYNEGAIGFYEHYGFQKTGVETPEEFDEERGEKLLPETEMVLKAQRATG